jgi:hypothetical protein
LHSTQNKQNVAEADYRLTAGLTKITATFNKQILAGFTYMHAANHSKQTAGYTKLTAVYNVRSADYRLQQANSRQENIYDNQTD